MFSFKVSAVTPAEGCVMFTSCTHSCFVLTADADLNCSSIISVTYANGYVKLPAGWFLICGKTILRCQPIVKEGLAPWEDLTVFMPQTPHPIRHHRETALGPHCNSELHLFGPA